MASSSTSAVPGTNLAPVHMLIARHPRTSMTHASLSSPTETHAAAAGIFPRPQPNHALAGSSSTPPPNNWAEDPTHGAAGHHGRTRSTSLSLTDLEEVMEFASPDGDRDSDDTGREPIELDPTFMQDARWPGTVKIHVEATTFWVHREVLVFASPFFEAALSGSWAETGRPASIASVITISQPPSVPESNSNPMASSSFTSSATIPEESRPNSANNSPNPSLNSDPYSSAEDTGASSENPPSNSAANTTLDIGSDDDVAEAGVSAPFGWMDASISCNDRNEKEDRTNWADKDVQARERDISLQKLQGNVQSTPGSSNSKATLISKPADKSTAGRKRAPYSQSRSAVATIHLREERASIFHDFLKFVYPHLECTITWYNVEGLMNISQKLVVPPLQQKCLDFLLTHAAGKPIKAMRIAELFNEEELYREASRFVLDNPGGWPDWELNTLRHATLWKLEKRRTWFLERVLKLGLVNIAKEYQCCVTCPDPPGCARALEEKWRQNYHALFRFGPVQPSMVYRYLRSLEGISPPLMLIQLSCQTFAKNWLASLFDRMFSLGVHMTPASGRGLVVSPGGNGPRRHFLYCTLQEEQEKRAKTGVRDGNGAPAPQGGPSRGEPLPRLRTAT
ncbi:hypothetical protein FRB95_003883 [Tulasnella sp. JGI-2019a]|nr:hypothetical protein FRB95_003883 [Tulasnella sp. JGI-2019a]